MGKSLPIFDDLDPRLPINLSIYPLSYYPTCLIRTSTFSLRQMFGNKGFKVFPEFGYVMYAFLFTADVNFNIPLAIWQKTKAKKALATFECK